MVKNLPAMQETSVQSLGSLEKGMATHSSILAWIIPWTEEPGRLYSPWGCKESDMTELLSYRNGHVLPRVPHVAFLNLDSMLKSRDVTLPTKVCLVKAMVFPVVMYGCESWTIKKSECQRIDAFELWCWRRLLRVLWTARRSNQSILKETSPEYTLEGLMLNLKLQYFGYLM